MDNDFKPNWVSPPGDTLFDIMNDRNITLTKMADNLGLSLEDADHLLKGKLKITPELADKMASEFGSTPKFWLNRQLQYDEDKIRLGLDKK